jgi:hypothetical protein
MAGETMTFTITGADGQEQQVTVPADSVYSAVEGAGYIKPDKVGKDIERRVASIIKNKGLRDPKELLTDDEFLAQAREGFVKAEEASGAKDQLREALDKQAREIENGKLKPLQDQLAARQAKEDVLLARDMERQILNAAREAGVQERFLKSRNGRPPLIVQQLQDMFAYDDDTSEFYASKGEDFVLSKKDGDNTYQTIAEAIEEWAQDPANADLLDKSGQPGPSRERTGNGGGGRHEPGIVILSEEEASDTPTWTKALASVNGDASKIRVKRNAERNLFM